MSLKAQKNKLADSQVQVEIIQHGNHLLTPFQHKLESSSLYPLYPSEIETLQVNVGKLCNQTCKHCHVDAGPDRREIMTKSTMQQCLRILKENPQLKILDITGGAPELNPHFRWLVAEAFGLNRHII